jgi:formylglycine-generating enzyme required for sulfatase activity
MLRITLITLALIAVIFSIGANTTFADNFTNSLGMEFVFIEPGIFTMGKDQNSDSDESPAHIVGITKGFYLSNSEVTQQEWMMIMEDNPSQYQNPNAPVDSVTWEQAQDFIKRLNQKEGTNIYRLPTEAQWEYAVRAATDTDYFFGNTPDALSDYAWFDDNSSRSTHPVKEKQANPFSLYDVYGNVFEWVEDLYSKDYYSVSPQEDPKGPETSTQQLRVLRGGAFDSSPFLIRSSFRSFYGQDASMHNIGFRVAADR